ncbi:MAG TPA: hypothetical protein VG839_00840 [Asticcacaulis sp.]|nr:hypothetical protein [Asticcacaulis sp.]
MLALAGTYVVVVLIAGVANRGGAVLCVAVAARIAAFVRSDARLAGGTDHAVAVGNIGLQLRVWLGDKGRVGVMAFVGLVGHGSLLEEASNLRANR